MQHTEAIREHEGHHVQIARLHEDDRSLEVNKVSLTTPSTSMILGSRVLEAPSPFFALEIQPRSSMFHAHMCLFRAGQNHPDETAAEAARATELDPLSPFIHGLTGLSLSVAGLHEAAIRYAPASATTIASYSG